MGIEECFRANKTDDKSHMKLQRIRRVETHCKWTPPGNKKGWIPSDSLTSCSMGMIRVCGRAVDQRRKSARRVGGGEPRGGLPDPQSSPAYPPQMSLQGALGDLNSPAISKVQLIPAANQVQAPAKTSAACFLADTPTLS